MGDAPEGGGEGEYTEKAYQREINGYPASEQKRGRKQLSRVEKPIQFKGRFKIGPFLL